MIFVSYEITDRPKDKLDIASDLADAERTRGAQVVLNRMKSDGCEDCLDCDERIPTARRVAAPWAVRCIDCQILHEKRLR